MSFLSLISYTKSAWLPVSAPIPVFSFCAAFFFFLLYSDLVPHNSHRNQLQQNIFLDYFFSLSLSLSLFLAAVHAPQKLKLLTSLILSTRAPATRTNKCSKSLNVWRFHYHVPSHRPPNVCGVPEFDHVLTTLDTRVPGFKQYPLCQHLS